MELISNNYKGKIMNILRSLVIFFAVVPVAFSSSLDATDQQNISQHFNAYVDAGKDTSYFYLGS